RKSIAGRFTETSIKCGDPGHVEADGVQIAEGATTDFAITRVRDGSALTSVNAPMTGQQVRGLDWNPRRPGDWQRGDRFQLQISADGEQAEGSNQFGFHEYPDLGPETKTIVCSSGDYGWTGKFDIAYRNDEIIVTVKIKLLNRQGEKPANAGDPLPAVGDPVSDADKASMKADIEGKLSRKIRLFRTDCRFGAACSCPKPILIVVQFVEASAHHEVNLFQGAGRANASNWTRVKTRANSWAHETGHLLGWYDEYSTGAVGSAPRWQNNEPANVMNVGLTVPPEYGWDFRDWFTSGSGESWAAR
ncbi:MAG: hypothetical protein EA400_11810, partial [Chromatiaceae bacterium]